MKYKLINKQTGEEHLCEKVVMDGFDYYVSDGEILQNDFVSVGWTNTVSDKYIIGLAPNEQFKVTEPYPYRILKVLQKYYNGVLTNDGKFWLQTCKKVIATNNPNIDIPQVVDKVLNLGFETIKKNELLSTTTEKLIAEAINDKLKTL